MARIRILSTGTAQRPQTFLSLRCAVEQLETPHSTGRITARDDSGIRVEVKCRRCGATAEYLLPRLPEGYRVYQVRVTGEDGPHLPAELRPLPYLEESFEVMAGSPQEAHERAEFAHSLRLTGHLTQYYLDGVLHPDERF